MARKKSKEYEFKLRKITEYDTNFVFNGDQVFDGDEPVVDSDLHHPKVYEEIIAEIDINNFSDAPGKQLLKDLIDKPGGVTYNKSRHGLNQPKSIKQRLNEKGYKHIAIHIHIKKGRIFLESLKIINKV
ncbi:MAG: hypothetical protein JW715_14655 [Sedimentisphaerales bacterium]|nr:hypothetical protein [Sedimentisphaerales bacterium]